MLAAFALLLSTAPMPPAAPDPWTARMAALYDDLCLKAFPDDAALARAALAQGAEAMTPADVKVTLRDDPGRGWALRMDGHEVLVILELPPFHACSVRFPSPPTADLAPYDAVVAGYAATHPGFTASPGLDTDRGDIHIHATRRVRPLPDGAEALMVIDQSVIDPARRARGETGILRRFVHQFAPPPR